MRFIVKSPFYSVIILVSDQNSLLVKRQIDNTTPGGMGLDRRGLVPSSHKRSKFRHTII